MEPLKNHYVGRLKYFEYKVICDNINNANGNNSKMCKTLKKIIKMKIQ